MIVIADLKMQIINNVVTENMNNYNTIIDLDNSISYTNLKKLVKGYRSNAILKKEVGKLLLFVRSLSNVKPMLLD